MDVLRRVARPDRPAPRLLALLALLALGGSPPAPAAVKECALPPGEEGEPWDELWAQRMTGADLMRGEIAASGPLEGGFPPRLVAVWDGGGGHGERVSQIIVGPRSSAVVPSDRPVVPTPFLWAGLSFTFVRWGSLFMECSRRGSCPVYVNQSMRWRGSLEMARAASELAGLGVTVVASADNGGSPVAPEKRGAALDGAALLVASVGPRGRPSDSTNYGDSVAVAAPAGPFVRTYDFDGNVSHFGGTSAAAPLVTGALAGYTLLSGHRLAGPDEARLLLAGTALPVPRLPDGHLLGDGILNAHGMAAVARRVRERCGPGGPGGGPGGGVDAGCASRLLKDPATYRFEEGAAGLVERAGASGAFPECLPGVPAAAASAGAGPSCERTAEAFDDLRRAALLAPRRPEAWEALACIRERRFPGGGEARAHADFLRAQAARARGEERDLVLDLCEGREDPRMAKYLPEVSLARVVGRGECRRRPEILRVARWSLFHGADDWTADPAMLFRNVLGR